MFKHLLLPTDGSDLSDVAIRKGIELAKAIKAKVTGFYVIPQFQIFTYRTEMLEDTREQFARDCQAARRAVPRRDRNGRKGSRPTLRHGECHARSSIRGDHQGRRRAWL